MKRYVGLALVVGFLAGADDPKKDQGKKGATALEGTWVIVSFTHDGKEDDNLKDDKVVVNGKNVTIKTKEGDRKVTFLKIDPKRKTMDFTAAEGPDKGKTMKGIYQLKGDELKFCHSEPGKARPKDFTAAKGSGNALIVLKRVKDK